MEVEGAWREKDWFFLASKVGGRVESAWDFSCSNKWKRLGPLSKSAATKVITKFLSWQLYLSK